MRALRITLWIFLVALPCALAASEHAPPPVALANVYRHGEVRVADYWVSEKYDGVRAWWDGRKLLTRTGNLIRAPAWFVARWPDEPLDGELWTGRGRFEEVASTVRDQAPSHAAWREVKYMIFDLPGHPGPFTERLQALDELVRGLGIPWLQAVPQFRATDEATLERKLREIVAAGGEGLILHRADAVYRSGRSDDLLKLKPHEDAEAIVIGYAPGKGKYAGLVGALIVERADGLQFRLGAGLSDAERRNPPPLGAVVTYTYSGKTDAGVPRFARFLRVRLDEP